MSTNEGWGAQDLNGSRTAARSEDSAITGPKLRRAGYFGLGAAAIQGACALLMAANSVKVLLGLGSAVAATGAQSIFHSGPVRYSLLAIAALVSSFTLYVLWNGRRLRRRSSSAWRIKPLSRRERWSIRITFATAMLSWVLIVGELIAHKILHH